MTNSLQAKMQTVTDKLNSFADLPPNWDSYGSVPISLDIRDRAKATMKDILDIGGENMPLPFIAPMGDGGVEFEWQLETGHELMLTIPPDGSIQFLLDEPGSETEGVIGEIVSLEQVIKRFLGVP